MKKTILFLCTLICLCSCGRVETFVRHDFFTMSTFASVICRDKEDGEFVEETFTHYEKMLSRTDKDSEISRLNSGEASLLSREASDVLMLAFEIARNTDFAFNPCMGALTDLWDINSGRNIIPDESDISAALALCNAEDAFISDGSVTIPEGMKIDLGGVAKGYALESAMKKLTGDSGKDEGDICINLGGNVAVCGSSESRKKSGLQGWAVGITNPFDKEEIFGEVILYDEIISVSGAYERYFEKNGEIYHHIFDGKTGYPAKSDLASAAVISSDGTLADALSTALFVMGRDAAVEFYKSGKYDFEMILVANDGAVLVSSQAAQNFQINEKAKHINKAKMTIINN